MNISQYKSKIASRFIPVEPELIGNKIFEADYYFTSIKYDGGVRFPWNDGRS